MSSQSSSTPSMDSDTREMIAELPFPTTDESDDDFVNLKPLKREIKELNSETSLSKNCVPGGDCEEWKPVKYRGTLTRPLAYFGNFEVKPETKELPWISDHTSGKVHDDMCTISMLFNENLTLPKEAENFIAQSAVLTEEARWERLKAAFYSFFPENVKKQAFELLSKMSSRDASRIIAKKTSRFANELILIWRPKNSVGISERVSKSESNSCVEAEMYSEEDAAKLNKDLVKIVYAYKETLAQALKRIESARNELASYDSFEKVACPGEIVAGSRPWSTQIKILEKAIDQCSYAPLLNLLEQAVARYEPRTGWIHVKTQPFYKSSEKNSMVSEGTYGIKFLAEYQEKETPEGKRAAINKQMENFEHGLRDRAQGHFLKFDFYHNEPGFLLYKFRVPYKSVSPQYCYAVLEKHLSENNRYCIVSRPQTSDFTVSHHEMKVYIEFMDYSVPSTRIGGYDSTLGRLDSSGFCLNCFSKSHRFWQCDWRKLGFACVWRETKTHVGPSANPWIDHIYVTAVCASSVW